MFVFFSWDLNKLCLEVVYSILHLLKVLLQLFVLAFIVAVNLTSDHLRVAIYDHIHGSCYFGEIQSYYQGFVLRFVIGCGEIELDYALNLIPFWAMEYHTSFTHLSVRRFICVDIPLWTLSCPLALHMGKLYDEVSNNLPLYGRTWAILYIEFA